MEAGSVGYMVRWITSVESLKTMRCILVLTVSVARLSAQTSTIT